LAPVVAAAAAVVAVFIPDVPVVAPVTAVVS
jgi:hypothetical protein